MYLAQYFGSFFNTRQSQKQKTKGETSQSMVINKRKQKAINTVNAGVQKRKGKGCLIIF